MLQKRLAWALFVVINPCVLLANRVDFGLFFCFINFSILLPQIARRLAWNVPPPAWYVLIPCFLLDNGREIKRDGVDVFCLTTYYFFLEGWITFQNCSTCATGFVTVGATCQCPVGTFGICLNSLRCITRKMVALYIMWKWSNDPERDNLGRALFRFEYIDKS